MKTLGYVSNVFTASIAGYLKVLKCLTPLLTSLRECPQGPEEQEKIFCVLNSANKTVL